MCGLLGSGVPALLPFYDVIASPLTSSREMRWTVIQIERVNYFNFHYF